jgi:hypothetical protein
LSTQTVDQQTNTHSLSSASFGTIQPAHLATAALIGALVAFFALRQRGAC